MHTTRIIAVSIAAGIVAGLILAAFNSTVVRPYTVKLADDYSTFLEVTGELDFDAYERSLQSLYLWQTAGPIITGGISGGAFAAVYAKFRTSKPLMAALIIVGVAWFSLYAMPAAKYPSSLEALFDQEAARSYYSLYSSYSAISGLAALGSAIAFWKTRRKNWPFGAAGVYLAIVAAMYFVFPPYPEVDYVDLQLLNGWRSVSAAGMTAFWFLLGIIAGVLLEFLGRKDTKKEIRPG